MNTELIISVLQVAAYIIIGGMALYLQTKGNLKAKASVLIAEAEATYKDATKAGGEKFEWVVSSLYAIIPAVLKPLISRQMLESLVQSTFDAMQRYAKMQLDKFVDKAV